MRNKSGKEFAQEVLDPSLEVQRDREHGTAIAAGAVSRHGIRRSRKTPSSHYRSGNE